MRLLVSGLGLCAGLLVSPVALAADKIDATFKFYWNGFLVSQADTSATITPELYDFSLDFRMRGVAKLFANGRSTARVTGNMTDGAPVPSLYENSGRWDGDDYAQTMRFDALGALTEQQLDWPEKWLEEFKREPVPEELQVGPDPASLVIKLISLPIDRAIAGEPYVARSFDGDSVFDWDIACLPEPVELEESGKSPFSGEAYECSFGGKLVAGDRILTEKQQKKAEKRRQKIEKKKAKGKYKEPKPPKLWVQAFEDGAYLLPVRAEMSTDMGRVSMYLTELNMANAPESIVTAAKQKIDTSAAASETEAESLR